MRSCCSGVPNSKIVGASRKMPFCVTRCGAPARVVLLLEDQPLPEARVAAAVLARATTPPRSGRRTACAPTRGARRSPSRVSPDGSAGRGTLASSQARHSARNASSAGLNERSMSGGDRSWPAGGVPANVGAEEVPMAVEHRWIRPRGAASGARDEHHAVRPVRRDRRGVAARAPAVPGRRRCRACTSRARGAARATSSPSTRRSRSTGSRPTSCGAACRSSRPGSVSRRRRRRRASSRSRPRTAGVDAVQIIGPRPGPLRLRDDELEAHFRSVIEAVRCDVHVSNNTALAGYELPLALVERLVDDYPHVVVVNVSDPRPEELRAYVTRLGRGSASGSRCGSGWSARSSRCTRSACGACCASSRTSRPAVVTDVWDELEAGRAADVERAAAAERRARARRQPAFVEGRARDHRPRRRLPARAVPAVDGERSTQRAAERASSVRPRRATLARFDTRRL